MLIDDPQHQHHQSYPLASSSSSSSFKPSTRRSTQPAHITTQHRRQHSRSGRSTATTSAIPMPTSSKSKPKPTTGTAGGPRSRARLTPHCYTNPLHRPPPPGTSPISRLPDELWLEVLEYLEWEEVLSLRPTCRRIAQLALAPPLHRSLTLFHLPLHPLPPVLRDHVLPLVRHLALHFAPSPPEWHGRRGRPDPATEAALLALLRAIPEDRLVSLSIPFSASFMRSWDVFGPELQRVGGRLERLNLRRAALARHDWAGWMRHVGVSGRGLRELDLGGTGITEIPPPSSMPWTQLQHLSLDNSYLLQKESLAQFLAALPVALVSIDMTGIQTLTLEALYGMRVVTAEGRTALTTVRVVGIDHLTRADVRTLERHWEDERAEAEQACEELSPNSSSLYTPQRAYLDPAAFSPASTSSSSWEATPSLGSSFGSSWGSSPGMMPRTPSPPAQQYTTPRLVPSTPPRQSLSLPSSGSVGDAWSFAGMGAGLATPSPRKPPRPAYTRVYPTFGFATRTPPVPVGALLGAGFDSASEELASPTPPPPLSAHKVTLVHSALLESDDEAGYRQFIGEVVDGTLGWD